MNVWSLPRVRFVAGGAAASGALAPGPDLALASLQDVVHRGLVLEVEVAAGAGKATLAGGVLALAGVLKEKLNEPVVVTDKQLSGPRAGLAEPVAELASFERIAVG